MKSFYKPAAAERPAITETLMEYLDTDLVCYRTAQPPELAGRQAAAWDPWLAWFSDRFGCSLNTTTELAALRQSDSAHRAVRHSIGQLDEGRFTVLQRVVSLSGSLVMALAFVDGRATAQDVYSAVRVEETYKAGIYNETLHGPDPAQDAKDRALREDLDSAENLLKLARP